MGCPAGVPDAKRSVEWFFFYKGRQFVNSACHAPQFNLTVFQNGKSGGVISAIL
jgi:hypothetical protein